MCKLYKFFIPCHGISVVVDEVVVVYHHASVVVVVYHHGVVVVVVYHHESVYHQYSVVVVDVVVEVVVVVVSRNIVFVADIGIKYLKRDIQTSNLNFTVTLGPKLHALE